jgi:urease accessory protein
MVAATMLLHGIGIALGLTMKHGQRWLPRLAGAGIALFGLTLLLPALWSAAA